MFKVYSKPNCPKCVELKNHLNKNNHVYETVDISVDTEARSFLVDSGFRTVPQVFDQNMVHIGNCDETIAKLENNLK